MFTNLKYYLFIHTTVVNATLFTFTQDAMRRIRVWAVGAKVYVTRNHDKKDEFVVSTDSGTTLFYINLEGQYC